MSKAEIENYLREKTLGKRDQKGQVKVFVSELAENLSMNIKSIYASIAKMPSIKKEKVRVIRLKRGKFYRFYANRLWLEE